MNADCSKPFVAPKPRLVCHASLKLPSPHMSAARGPKPSVAPKPKLTVELDGSCLDGDSFASDGEADKTGLSGQTAESSLAKDQVSTCILKSPQTEVEGAFGRAEFSRVTQEEKEEELLQHMDEDWKGTDGALTEDTDSLETLWVSESGLTADSEEAVEMVDTDVTEDMDAEGCDAGEALADAEGLSVGDMKELPGCYSDRVKQEDETGDCTADDITESLSDEPRVLCNGTATVHVVTNRELDQGKGSGHLSVSNAPKFSSQTRGTCKNLQNFSCYNFASEDQKSTCDATNGHTDPTHKPFYVSSEDIISEEPMPKSNTALESPLASLKHLSPSSCQVSLQQFEETVKNGQASGDYAGIANNGYSVLDRKANKVGTYQKWLTKELGAPSVEDSLNQSDYPSRLRLVSVSMPADSDTSLASSFSDSTLLSPDDSELSDLEGHMVAFLDDDTTDTEQDVDEDHVYEEPGRRSHSENILPFEAARSAKLHPHLLPRRLGDGHTEGGAALLGRSFQPALSSSPMLNSRQQTRVRPLYLSQYPRSISVEGHNSSSGVYSYMEGSPRLGGAICSSGSFSRRSPLSSSGVSTPTSLVDIPPPFELAYITKKPITKSSPSIFTEGEFSEKNRKSKSSLKRFLMLKFRRKLADNKSEAEVNPSVSKSSVESSRHADRTAVSRSPPLHPRSEDSPKPASKFLYYKDLERSEISTAFLSRSVVRVESFEERSRVPFMPLPLTKPRSISFPNTNSSDYENVPPISSDYENVQVPERRPVRQVPFTNFFDRPSRVLSSANETDGYVDMSSLPGFKMKNQAPDQETESAYTEAYNVCSVAAAAAAGTAPPAAPLADAGGETTAEEDQGRTSEEEEGGADGAYRRQQDGRSRAFYVAKDLMDTERRHVKALKLLQEDFREAVATAVGEEGEPVLDEERLREILNELPDVYTLHRRILNELENRLRHWDENQSIADIFLSRRAEFLAFTTYIGHYDRSMTLLDDSCRTSAAFAAIVHQFEQQSPPGDQVSLKHQLLKVVVRVAQYRMILTDYLNNLSPDSREYEDTQAALALVSDIADQANDSLKDGENLLRLVNIEYSVRGQQDLLQPGRVFVKEGTLMKVSRKSRQPRHLFLMNDVLLYTYPQQDGKYRLKNTLSLTGLKVSKPSVENVQYALKMEGAEITITLSASSFIEREDWFYAISRTVTEHCRGPQAAGSSKEPRDPAGFSIGDSAPALVPVSQVMMCMNCTSDFSLTLRRHHCHGCGRIVCRSCCRNRYPLKYMRDRMAKVCDHCYGELKKRGNTSTLSGASSPRPHRSTRPLSAVFQNIHPPNIWRHRKGTLSITQVTVSEEGSISGTLHRTKKSKRSWKRLWFLLKDKVLYTYRAQEEKVASESLPLLGFTVKLPGKPEGVEEQANIFQLYHKNTLYYTFKAKDNHTAQRWVDAMEEATVL